MKTLLYFYSPTCVPCRFMGPIIESACSIRKLPLEKVDVTKDTQRASAFHVSMVPTIVLVDGSDVKGQRQGSQTKRQIEEFLS